MTEAPIARFHRWHSSLVAGAFFSLGSLLQLGGVVTDSTAGAGELFGVVIALAMGILAVRGFRSSTLIIQGGHLIVRTLLRRRVWPLGAIREAVVETGAIGLGAYVRRYPVIHFDDGQTYECREINTSRARSGELAPIVEAVNQAIRRTKWAT